MNPVKDCKAKVMAYMYSKKVMELFRHPHNMGDIKNPDGAGKVGNPVCGDVMVMYIKVDKNKKGQDIIKDAKVKTFGCVAAISTSSVLTDMIKGKTIEYSLSVTKDDIIKKLGRLPVQKIHCSLLAADALVEAVYNYLSKNKLPIPGELARKHERIKMGEKSHEEK